MSYRAVRTIVGLAVMAMLSGCASDRAPVSDADHATGYATVLNDNPAAVDEFVRAASDADVVLIGELHDAVAGQALAADVWDRVVGARPRSALAMEFFERDEQLMLDDYLAGYIKDEAEFKHLSGRTESNYPAGHRRMVEAAREHGRPVFAANAPRRYVRIARAEGYDALRKMPRDRQPLFKIPNPQPGGVYKETFYSLDFGHGPLSAAPENADAMFRSQSLWDATMADTVVRALGAGHSPVFLVVGAFHVMDDGGTKQLIRRARPRAKIVTFAVIRQSEAAGRVSSEAADFVLFVPSEPEPNEPEPGKADGGAEN